MSSSTPPKRLTAQYGSPSDARSFSHDLSGHEVGTVDGRSAYLRELRSHAGRLQGQINDLLTRKMEEDNAKAAAAGGAADSRGREAEEKARKEEENYGEEIVDEDA